MPSGTPDYTYGYRPNSYGLIETVTGPVHTVANAWESNRNVLDSKTNSIPASVPPVSKYDYTVNSLGQRTKVDLSGSAFSAATTIDWTYDSRGQLTSATHGTAANSRAYSYDSIGNRIASEEGAATVSDPPSVSGTTIYNAGTDSNSAANAVLNQYFGITPPGLPAVEPAYDADGNATAYPLPTSAGANATLTWDAENRLVKVQTANGSTIDYRYDYLGRRVKRTQVVSGLTSSTHYLYDGWNCIAEYSQSFSNPAVLAKTYTWGLDLSGSMQGAGGVGGLLVQNSIGSTTSNYHPTYDGNGNVSEYLDDTGAVIEHNEYDPFGNLTTGGTVSNFTYRFSTKPQDALTGLYYYGYRYYDPVTGRWPSRDPIGEEGGVNLHSFVGNDAINHIDILGLNDFANAFGIVGRLYIRSSCDDCPELLEGFSIIPEKGPKKALPLESNDDNFNAFLGVHVVHVDAIHTPIGVAFKVGDGSSINISCNCCEESVTITGDVVSRWDQDGDKPPKWPGNVPPSTDPFLMPAGGISTNF